jgi:hypothetical protein
MQIGECKTQNEEPDPTGFISHFAFSDLHFSLHRISTISLLPFLELGGDNIVACNPTRLAPAFKLEFEIL